jgi:hypothetical protein
VSSGLIADSTITGFPHAAQNRAVSGVSAPQLAQNVVIVIL